MRTICYCFIKRSYLGPSWWVDWTNVGSQILNFHLLTIFCLLFGDVDSQIPFFCICTLSLSFCNQLRLPLSTPHNLSPPVYHVYRKFLLLPLSPFANMLLFKANFWTLFSVKEKCCKAGSRLGGLSRKPKDPFFVPYVKLLSKEKTLRVLYTREVWKKATVYYFQPAFVLQDTLLKLS